MWQQRLRHLKSAIWPIILAVGSGLAFSILILTVTVLPSDKPLDRLVVGYLIAANVFLVLLVLVLAVVYADSRRLKHKDVTRTEERLSQILNRLNGIFETRTGLSTYLLRNQQGQDAFDACFEQSSDFLEFLVNETRVMFEEYTASACAVSIKLLVASETGIPYIKTYVRDSKSYFIRKDMYEGDGRYPYTDHSPFRDIISKPDEGHFLCNDLQLAARQGKYENGNKHWPKLYNAVLVVPIQEPGVTTSENVTGFLCVDSLTAKFDEAIALPIARIVATSVFYVIHSLTVFETRLAANRKAS